MVHDDETRFQAEQKKNMQRNNIARKGLGSSRPHRRVVDGHNKPCTECGTLDWRKLTTAAGSFLWRLWFSC